MSLLCGSLNVLKLQGNLQALVCSFLCVCCDLHIMSHESYNTCIFNIPYILTFQTYMFITYFWQPWTSAGLHIAPRDHPLWHILRICHDIRSGWQSHCHPSDTKVHSVQSGQHHYGVCKTPRHCWYILRDHQDISNCYCPLRTRVGRYLIFSILQYHMLQ